MYLSKKLKNVLLRTFAFAIISAVMVGFLINANQQITNAQATQSITIVKDDTSNSGESFTIRSYTGTGYILSDDGTSTNNSVTLGTVDPNRTYGYTELPKSGWALTSISCTGQTNSVVTTSATAVEIYLAAGEDIVCTFTNSPANTGTSGSITIMKDAGGVADDFSFTGTGGIGSFTLDDPSLDDMDGVNNIFTTGVTLAAGSYTIDEIVPSGWELSNIACSGQTATTYQFGNNSAFQLGDTNVTINLAATENIFCKFINVPAGTTQTSTVTVKKVDMGGMNTQEFTLYENTGGSLRDFTLKGGEEEIITSVFTGTYRIGEYFTSDWVRVNVDCGSSPVTYLPGNHSTFTAGYSFGVEIAVGENEDIVCTFYNALHEDYPHGGVTIKKACNGGPTSEGFPFWAEDGVIGNNFSLGCGEERGIDFLSPDIYRFEELTDLPDDWEFSDVQCTWEDGSAIDPTKLTITGPIVDLDIQAGEDFICTFTNSFAVSKDIYISPSNPANVGFDFYDEDIILHDGSSWSMYFDGSDVGLGGPPDLNAFHILDDGNLLLSFDQPVTLGGTLYDDSDIVLFTVNSLGTVTSGTFSMFFDGSTDGFDTIGEDIDAITMNAAGELVISTLGSADIPRAPFADLTQQDDDLARRRNSDGIWLRYFDGSDVDLTINTEDVWGAQVDATSGVIYLSTLDVFTAAGLSGDGNDIFTCTPGTLGNNTSCPLALYWDGDAFGLTGERIDALAVLEPVGVSAASRILTTEVDPRDSIVYPGEDEGYDDVEDTLEDVDDILGGQSLIPDLYLPFMIGK